MTHLPQLERDLATVADRMVVDESRVQRRTATPAGRRRPLRPLFAITGLSAIVLAVALAVGIGGPTRLDVVAEARAALAPHDGILHTLVIERSASFEGGRRISETPGVQDHTRVEQWTMTRPPRWRTVFTRIPKQTTAARRLAREGDFAPLEVAYGGGTYSSWDHGSRVARRTTGYSDKGQVAKPIGIAFSSVPRSIDGVRRMLERGQLEDAGTATLGGRPVRQLRQRGDAARRRATTELFVDPTTFTPVRITTRFQPFVRQAKVPARIRSSEVRTVVDFVIYERLPDSPEQRRNLQITPPPEVRVWQRTHEQVLAQQRARDRARSLRLARAKRR